ncbi:unnamed protein product [Calypogeia fissa]
MSLTGRKNNWSRAIESSRYVFLTARRKPSGRACRPLGGWASRITTVAPWGAPRRVYISIPASGALHNINCCRKRVTGLTGISATVPASRNDTIISHTYMTGGISCSSCGGGDEGGAEDWAWEVPDWLVFVIWATGFWLAGRSAVQCTVLCPAQRRWRPVGRCQG